VTPGATTEFSETCGIAYLDLSTMFSFDGETAITDLQTMDTAPVPVQIPLKHESSFAYLKAKYNRFHSKSNS